MTIDYVGINASTGEEFDTSYGKDARRRSTLESGHPRACGPASSGAQAGDRVLITIASKDGFDPTGQPGRHRQEGRQPGLRR